MRIEQFHYLVEIGRLRSISAASRSLHIGQTTLSAMVKAVEDEIGYPVFQRTPNGVIVTPAGSRFLELAWEIDVKYEEMIALKRRIANGGFSVNALLCPTIALRFAIPLVERFYGNDLHCNLTIEELQSKKIARHVQDGSANIGVAYLSEREIARTTQEHPQLMIQRMFEDALCALVPREHPLAKQSCIDAHSFASERICMQKGLEDDPVLGNFMPENGKVTCFSEVDLCCQAVQEQGLISFLPKYVAQSCPLIDLEKAAIVPICNTPRENRIIACLITGRERDLRYQEKIFKQCIEEEFHLLTQEGGEQQ